MTVPAAPVRLMLLLLTVAVIAATSGCSSGMMDSLIAQLSQQSDPAVPSKTTKRRTAPKAAMAPVLPHGRDCVCPTIVSGTSHGCWEAL